MRTRQNSQSLHPSESHSSQNEIPKKWYVDYVGLKVDFDVFFDIKLFINPTADKTRQEQ